MCKSNLGIRRQENDTEKCAFKRAFEIQEIFLVIISTCYIRAEDLRHCVYFGDIEKIYVLEKGKNTDGHNVRNEEKEHLLVLPVGQRGKSNTCSFVKQSSKHLHCIESKSSVLSSKNMNEYTKYIHI